jgi:hypothetical protein
MIPDDSWLVAAGHSQTSAIKGMYGPKSVKVPQLRLGRGFQCSFLHQQLWLISFIQYVPCPI